jgi:ribosomal protein L37E
MTESLSSQRDLGTYEMLWDCRFCGAAAMPAKTHQFCPSCGAAQDPKTRRFPTDAEKRAVENYVPKGADVVCRFCSTPNAADSKFCQQCGASLEGAQTAARQADAISKDGRTFESTAQAAPASPPPASKKGVNWVIIAMIAAALLCVGIVLLATFWNQTAAAVVTAHRWSREIIVESLLPTDESAWCDATPADAYNISSRREQRDTRQVPDGETCQLRRIDNGDGTFTEREECQPRYRDEPVYDDRCYFTVDRWAYLRSVETQGEGAISTPTWGQVSFAQTSGVGAEREGGRAEVYVISLRVGEETFECEVDFETWQAASLESVWQMEVNMLTRRPLCGRLTRE